MRFRLLAAIIILSFDCFSAKADVAADLTNFWNDLGGAANATGPTTFQGQSAGYYTLGNVRTRSSNRNAALTTFSLPSIEAGCGGIDLFAGSLSFISEEELVALSKAIASNAVGYAFDLALETLSPVIAETMKDLRARLQELNLNNINSCEAAKGLVNAAWPKQSLARDKICAELGSSQGTFTDYAASRHECGSTTGAGQVTTAASEQALEALPDNVNLAWHMMRGDRVDDNDWLKDDDDLAEVVQTLTGTVTIAGETVNYLPSRFNTDTLQFFIEGTGTNQLNAYSCDDHDDCLAITDEMITITEVQSMQGRVRQSIDALIANIQNNTTPTAANINMVNRTTIPVWRILNVYSAYSGPIVDTEISSLVSIVAFDLTLAWLEALIVEIRARSTSSELAGYPVVEAWVESIRDVERQINTLRVNSHQLINRALLLVERVDFIENKLASQLGEDIGQVVFSSGNKPAGGE